MEQFEIVELKAGGRSLRQLGGGETFHPVVGPMAEARLLHVQQQRLLERSHELERLVIWDVGLGAGANAVAAIEALQSAPCPVELHSFDLTAAPLHFALTHAEELGYPSPHVALFERLLSERSASAGAVEWNFYLGDFYDLQADLPAPDAVFYDPYSPGSNPEMWTLKRFTQLRSRLRQPCLLTNYTRSTAVRVALLLAGFHVGCGVGVGEKDQTTIASNDPRLLEAPFNTEWLSRVRNSTNAAPLRSAPYSRGPISADDLWALESHPQFMSR